MGTESNTLLVTWDFSPVSEYALEYATAIAKKLFKVIQLIHVIKPNLPQPEKERIRQELSALTEQATQKSGIQTTFVTKEGSIFSTISNYATDTKPFLVFMGTHGIKGYQKIFGSWALKVIIGSEVPFFVVQRKPKPDEEFAHIVYPIDFKNENKEMLYGAIGFGKFFNSTIHLFLDTPNDRSLVQKVNVNKNFAIRFLNQYNLQYEIHNSKHGGSFSKKTIEFAHEINADVLLTLTTKYITFADYMLGAPEQKTLVNPYQIPVITFNPKASFASVGQFMFGRT